jgi:formylglycine-generating enzyme required for sulfatase activity
VAGSNPSHFKGDDLPVEKVSWHDCEAWMVQASARRGWLGLRFPTEAEWEYACRAGTTRATYRGGNDIATLDAIAWTEENSDEETHTVKQKVPNPWGLYDMLGNVWEWCADGRRTYESAAEVDPGGGLGAGRVRRGGSWSDGAPVRARRVPARGHARHSDRQPRFPACLRSVKLRSSHAGSARSRPSSGADGRERDALPDTRLEVSSPLYAAPSAKTRLG